MNRKSEGRRRRRLTTVIPGAAAITFSLLALLPVLALGQTAAPTPIPTPAVSATPGTSTVAAPNPVRAGVHAAPVFALPPAVAYNDCNGATQLNRTAIYQDSCLPGVYLVAHNPGPFTSILTLSVGSLVTYGGRTYRVTSVALMMPAAQWAVAHTHPAALTLQTCANDALGRVWVFKGSAL